MILLIFPPIYALWQYAIGKTLSEKLNLNKGLVRFLGISHVVLFSLAFIGGYIVKWFYPEMPTQGKEIAPFVISIFTVWFALNAVLTRLTVKYEREQDSEKYYGTANFRDYIWRFFAFFYWPSFIWSYQKTVNTYVE